MSLALQLDHDYSIDAAELDVLLYTRARMRTVIDRHLGKGLLRLSQGDNLLRLGYAKLGDYVNQRLGIGARYAQELRTLEARLPHFPVIEAAYDNGGLSKSKVRALLAAILPEDEAFWVRKAQCLTVRKLNQELKKHKARPVPATSEHTPEYVHPIDNDLHPSGRWLDIDVTAELAVKWRVACDIERRQLGYNAPDATCLEAFCAEFSTTLIATKVMYDVADELERLIEKNQLYDLFRLRRRERRLAQAESRSRDWRHLPQTMPFSRLPAELLGPMPDDPFAIDHRLRKIVTYRQQRTRQFMQALATMKHRKLYMALGFRDMAQYAVERLGMSRRCTDQFIWLHHKFDTLPVIAEAFYQGHIHQTQAEYLATIATPETQRQSLDAAQKLTVRHLREKIGRFQEDQLFRDILDGRRTCAPLTTRHRLKIWLPKEVEPAWTQTEVICAVLHGSPALSDCFEAVVDAYLDEYLPLYRKELKAHPIFSRDGWQCAVPVCTNRANLHEHHYVFRSHGGSDAPENLGAVCKAHHLAGIHMQRIHVSGQAPDHLTWTLGVSPNGPPHLVVERGQIKPGYNSLTSSE